MNEELERMKRVSDNDIAEFMLLCADHMSNGGVWTLHQVVMLMREGAARIKEQKGSPCCVDRVRRGWCSCQPGRLRAGDSV